MRQSHSLTQVFLVGLCPAQWSRQQKSAEFLDKIHRHTITFLNYTLRISEDSLTVKFNAEDYVRNFN